MRETRRGEPEVRPLRGCRPLSEAEVSAVLEALTGPNALRDRALWILGVRSGFRISEILSLRVRDVFQSGRILERVTVPRRYMKRKAEGRTVLLHPAAREALRAWITELEARGQSGPDRVTFPSRKGTNRPIGRRQAWRILRQAFEGAELVGNLGTHTMRKTFADRLYERLGGDLVKLQKALGHRSILSTAAYVSFREEEIDAAILSV